MDCQHKEECGSGGVSGGSESDRFGYESEDMDGRPEEDCASDGSYYGPYSDCEDQSDPLEANPVLKAIAYDKLDDLILALGLGGDGNQRGGIDKPVYGIQYALYWACALGKLNCVKVLLERGADLFSRNSIGETPLHAACSGGRAEHRNVAEHLIKSELAKNKQPGVDNMLGAVNTGGETPLHTAATVGSCDVIQLLLDYGADPCKENNWNEFPCALARHGTEARLLLECAAAEQLFSQSNK